MAYVPLAALVAIGGIVSVIDLRSYRVPDLLVLPGTAAIALWQMAVLAEPPLELIAAGTVGFGLVWAVRMLSRGQIGLGDAKFSLMIAVALGLAGWFAAMFVAAVLGGVLAAVLLARGRVERKTRLPFAPFMYAGGVLAGIGEVLGVGY